MNKRLVTVLFFAAVSALIFSGLASAQNETAADISEKGYGCLRNQIDSVGNVSLKEATFGILALGSYKNLINRIDGEKDAANCWPKGACNIKETAQAALAYQRINKDASGVKKWLLSKNATSTELKWLLEIDITNKQQAECTIKDGLRENKITIGEDMKISGNPGSCLSIDQDGFMLRISNNCLGNEFQISCNQDFITSTLYQKSTGGTIFVMPETHSAASLGITKESVKGECMKVSGASCDYEGTLWGTHALSKLKEDTSRFMPYLLALADDNARFFPSAFLYVLAGGEDQYNDVIQAQKQSKFWESPGTRENRYYDTSLAMVALDKSNAVELDNAKAYLTSIQMESGCWNNNNIRDTAFILYSGWPGAAQLGPTPVTTTPCESPYSCETLADCRDAGGTTVEAECIEFGKLCCTKKAELPSCIQKKGGQICGAGFECQGGRIESAADGSCCIDGACIPVAEATCTPAGGLCRISCEDNEEEISESCPITTDRCCIEKKEGRGWTWIVLLILLIILVILAIVFREKVKMWWFKLREKFKRKPSAPGITPARAGMPATLTRPPTMMQRPAMPPARPGMPVRAVSRDREMEEALRKLREMSKR